MRGLSNSAGDFLARLDVAKCHAASLLCLHSAFRLHIYPVTPCFYTAMVSGISSVSEVWWLGLQKLVLACFKRDAEQDLAKLAL